MFGSIGQNDETMEFANQNDAATFILLSVLL